MQRVLAALILSAAMLLAAMPLHIAGQATPPGRPSSPSIIYVPDDYPTLRDAIGNATDGDIIVIRANYSETYVGSAAITFDAIDAIADTNIYAVIDKNLTIRAERPGSTLINGTYAFLFYVNGSNVVLKLENMDVVIGGSIAIKYSEYVSYAAFSAAIACNATNITIILNDTRLEQFGSQSYLIDSSRWVRDSDHMLYNGTIGNLTMVGSSLIGPSSYTFVELGYTGKAYIDNSTIVRLNMHDPYHAELHDLHVQQLYLYPAGTALLENIESVNDGLQVYIQGGSNVTLVNITSGEALYGYFHVESPNGVLRAENISMGMMECDLIAQNLDASMISAFLVYLEGEDGLNARKINASSMDVRGASGLIEEFTANSLSIIPLGSDLVVRNGSVSMNPEYASNVGIAVRLQSENASLVAENITVSSPSRIIGGSLMKGIRVVSYPSIQGHVVFRDIIVNNTHDGLVLVGYGGEYGEEHRPSQPASEEAQYSWVTIEDSALINTSYGILVDAEPLARYGYGGLGEGWPTSSILKDSGGEGEGSLVLRTWPGFVGLMMRGSEVHAGNSSIIDANMGYVVVDNSSLEGGIEAYNAGNNTYMLGNITVTGSVLSGDIYANSSKVYVWGSVLEAPNITAGNWSLVDARWSLIRGEPGVNSDDTSVVMLWPYRFYASSVSSSLVVEPGSFEEAFENAGIHVSGEASGIGVIVAGVFGEMPVAPPPNVKPDRILDLAIPTPQSFADTLVFSIKGSRGLSGAKAYWRDGTTWREFSHYTYDPDTGIYTLVVSQTGTSPTIGDLSGTPVVLGIPAGPVGGTLRNKDTGMVAEALIALAMLLAAMSIYAAYKRL